MNDLIDETDLKIENPEIYCRLCLKNCSVHYSIDEDISYAIKALTSVKVSESDGLPTSCCSECLEDVHKAYAIRCRIIESDKILRNNPRGAQIANYLQDKLVPVNTEESRDKNEDTKEAVREVIDVLPSSKQTNANEDFNLPKLLVNSGKNSHKTRTLKLNIANIVQSHDTFTCHECDTKLKGRLNFTKHLQNHDLSRCKICGTSLAALGSKGQVSRYLRHMEIHFSGPQVCELCGAVAKNTESLRGHMFYMHKCSDTQYKCEKCNKFFKYKYKYTLHIQKNHIGNTTHMCEMCGKGFFTNFAVRKHIKMKHLKMRPYVCEYCNKGFSSRHARVTHVRQHTNETPFICYICSEGFRQKVSLKTHLKSKHGVLNMEEKTETDSCATRESYGEFEDLKAI